MIIQVEMYTAECDQCGVNSEFGDYSCYHDKDTLIVDASDNGWHFVDGLNGKCYCEDCHEFNDNDELVIKRS
jgi:hypothetical protein